MITRITSRDNKILKTVRSLHRKKGRLQTGLYFAEGTRLVGEALSYAEKSVRLVLVSESYMSGNSEYVIGLEKAGKCVYVADDKLFGEICDTETPQGIAVVLEIPREEDVDFSSLKYVLVLDGVAEPGNMGTIIRTAEASGIEAICLMPGCVDVYSPKVVRASMGSVLRTSFVTSSLETVSELKSNGFEVVTTALHNSCPIEQAGDVSKRAIVIGNEANGVSDEVLSASDKSVRIEMSGKVESLNVAVASGIAMYMLRPR